MIPDFQEPLYQLLKEEIQQFSKLHSSETFYAASIDCNADYAEIITSFNTPEALEHLANNRSDVELHNMKAFGNESSEPIKPDERREELRWDSAAWKYFGTADMADRLNEDSWENKWEDISDEIQDFACEEDVDEDEFTNGFISQVTAVAKRLIAEGCFSNLKLTPDFKLRITNHDQCDEEFVFIDVSSS